MDFPEESWQVYEGWSKNPKGVLLEGHSRNRVVQIKCAGEAGVPSLVFQGSVFVEMFVGVGASRVRDLFEGCQEKCTLYYIYR